MTSTSRRPVIARMLSLLLAMPFVPWSRDAGAADAAYPQRPVRMVVGFPPGQAQDVLGRAVAERLGAEMGQAFVVDNRPGAGGIISATAVKSSPPDGYTLWLTSSGPLAVNPSLYASLPYDPQKDFVPVATIASLPMVLVTSNHTGITSVKDLVERAKAQPGKLNYASNGNGTTNHLVTEMFLSATGAKITHVPYSGVGPAMTDLLGGRLDVMFETTLATLPFVRQGQLRALGVSSTTRSTAAPDVPTIAEQGYPGFVGVAWVAIMAPAKTPAPIVAKLNAAVNRALASPELRKFFAQQGAEPLAMSPDQLTALMKSETVKWGLAVRNAGLKKLD